MVILNTTNANFIALFTFTSNTHYNKEFVNMAIKHCETDCH